MAERRRGHGRLTLGGEQAEADPLLDDAFYESEVYRAIAAHDNPDCFLIGRTGSGKSAILQRIEDVFPEHVVRINPEDLSLPYILDLGVFQQLSALNVHLDPLFIALWKHVLLVELIKHRYRVDSPETKRTRLAALRDRIKGDSSKKAALEYLEQFAESFWCETDERVREITTNFEKSLGASANVQTPLPGLGRAGFNAESKLRSAAQVRSEEAERYQRLVNETQLPRLNKMIKVLDEEILDSSQVFTYVIVDDLDRDWVDEQLANDLIRCLFRAVLDLQKVRHLKVIVALRVNIFEHLNFGSRTGGQEEKFRSLSHRVRWTRRELEEFADERVRVASERWGDGTFTRLKDLLPQAGRQRGNPSEYVIDRTLMRPRDLIAFLNECLSNSSGRARLSWRDITNAEPEYSKKRLLALRDEWKPTFPGVDSVFTLFEAAAQKISRAELSAILDQVALLPAQEAFPGVVWMTELTEPLWSGVGLREWPELYSPLVKLLYDIGFLGIGDAANHTHYAYDLPGFADLLSNLDAASHFAVHPAFRATLDIGR